MKSTNLRTALDAILQPGESIRAMVGGRPEMSTPKGQVVLPALGMMLCSESRVILLERTGDDYALQAEIPYAKVTDAKVYRDVFSGTIGGTYTLHVQDDVGELYRLVAVDEDKARALVDFVQAMMAAEKA